MFKSIKNWLLPAGIDQKKETALDQEKPLLSNGTTAMTSSQGGKV